MGVLGCGYVFSVVGLDIWGNYAGQDVYGDGTGGVARFSSRLAD